MSDRVVKILFSGAGNPSADLRPGAVNEVDAIIATLDDAPDRPDLARIHPECWPPPEHPTYVFELAHSGLVYVAGPIARLSGRRLWDQCHALTMLAERALREADAVAAVRTCRECSAEDLGDLWVCACDPPIVQPWNHTATLTKNNCYSYACRKLWCEAWGSTPGGELPRSLAHLKQLIEADGWEEVAKHELSTTSGHFIALMIGKQVATNYHFLRLDERWWTHKVSYLVASACDAAGAPMPWDSLEAASFAPWWQFETYYRARPGATLDHCLP